MTPPGIAHYRITAKLGEGGMGEVYRATDTKLGREVAIKILPEAFAHDAERMARFEREAQVLAALNHPNIAAIYGIEERALVMELVEGETLAGPLPVDNALDYARQIAAALEAAHEKGIIHRDLKPANVKVTPDGTVKVLDFGLAKLSEEPQAERGTSVSPTLTISPTRAGMILGTAAYMAPEQARGAAVDKRADIWAFGAVLYEMLSGRPAFTGESTSDILAGVLRAEPDWSALPPATPGSIRQLLRRCLERDRKQRLRDIGEARIGIEHCLANPNEAATPALVGRSVLPWAAVAGVAVLVAAAALAGWWMATRPVMRPWLRLSVELGADTPLAKGAPGDGFTVSPDGRHLAFVTVAPDGKRRLALRPLDQNHTTLLAGTDGAAQPFFSADSQWIAFFTEQKLKKISVTGGAPVSLCDSPGSGPGGSWGDDGNIIVALTPAGGLSRVPSNGGMPVAVTELNNEKAERTHRFPQVLPGSQAVLFTSHTTRGDYNDATIETVSLKSGQRKTVLRGGFLGRYLPTGHLIYVHEDTLFAAPFDLEHLAVTGTAVPVLNDVRTSASTADLAISENGALIHMSGTGSYRAAIFWLDNDGKVEPLRAGSGSYAWPRFSPDGKRLAFTDRNGQGSDIWVQELGRDGVASRLTTPVGSNVSPVWTPDGKYVVFLSENQPHPGIYGIRADGGSEAQRLLEGRPGALPYSFSPDSKWLAISADDGIWIAPVEEDRDGLRLGKPQAFLRGSGDTTAPRFSPDGRWLAYMSREAGPMEVFVRPFPRPQPNGGGRWQISISNGGTPIWSHDGRELFYRGVGVMVVDYTTKGDTFVPGQPRRWSDRRLAATGNVALFDVAPDGKRIAAVMQDEDARGQKPITHLVFVENFFDELRRRVPAGGK